MNAEQQQEAKPRHAIKIDAIQDTIEDYTETFIPPLATDLRRRFAVVQDRSTDAVEAEVVSIDDKGRLVHYRYDPQAQSGWTREFVEVPHEPGDIRAITAFYREGGILQVVLQYEAVEAVEADENAALLVGEVGRSVLMTRSTEGSWSRAKLSPALANVLGRVQQLGVHLDESGKRYLFGITRSMSPASFFILEEREGGEWSMAGMHPIRARDTAYHLQAGYAPGQLMVTRCNGEHLAYRPGSMKGGRFGYTGDERSIDLRHGPLEPDQVLPFPGRAAGEGEVHFLFLGAQKHLDHVVLREDKDPRVTLLSGDRSKPATLAQVELSVDAQGRYTALVLSGKRELEQHELWVVRQADSEIEFQTRWTHQGDRLRTIGCPVTLSRGPELFGVDFGHRLVHTQQPLVGEADSWHTREIEVPRPSGAKADRCTSHMLEMCCRDRHGVEVPQSIVHLRSDRRTAVMVDGFAYKLSPTRSVPVRADLSGRLSVRVVGGRGEEAMVSSDLTAPQIFASLPQPEGDPVEHAFSPDLSLYKRMADEKVMTGERLRRSSLVDPDRLDGATADALASMCRHAANKRLRQDADQDPEVASLCATPLESKRWELHFKEGGIEVGDATEETFAGTWEACEEADSPELFRSFGDFIRWVANTAKAFVRAFVEITDKAFRLIIEGVGNFVLEIGKEIGQFFEGMFKRLAEAFDKAVNAAGELLSMFEALFHWEDIIRTKRALKAGIEGLLGCLSASLKGDIPDRLTGHFDKARAELSDRFESARAQLGDKRLDQIAGEAQPGKPNPFEDERFAELGQSHGVQATYVTRMSTPALSKAKLAMAEPSAEQVERLGGFIERLKTIFDKAGLQQAADEITKNMAKFWEDPSQFLKLGLSTLLTIFEAVLKVALTVAEELLKLLFQLLGEALELFTGLLTQEIPIPVISSLYERYARDKLSLLDLACLMLAAPATIIYKVLRRGEAPFKDEDEARVRRAMAGMGDLGRIIDGSKSDVLTSGQQDLRALKTVFGICSACIIFVELHLSPINDAVAMDEGEVPLLPWLMITVSAIGLVLSTPVDVVAGKPKTGDWLGFGIWLGEICWFCFNAIVTAALHKKKAEWVPFVGPVLCGIVGAVRSVASIVGIVVNGIEGNIKGVLASIGGLVSGLVDIDRILIPAVKRTGKAGPFIALWILSVGAVGNTSRFALQIAATAVPDKQPLRAA